MLLIYVPANDVEEGVSFDKLLPVLKSNRDLVFFDELLVGYVVLTRDSPIKCSSIVIDISVVPQDLIDNTSHTNLSFSIGTLTLDSTSLVFNDSSSLVWKFEFPLVYPKKKQISPCLVIAATVVHETQLTEPKQSCDQDNPLPDFVPGFQKNLVSELNYSVSSSQSEKLQLYLTSPPPQHETNQSATNEYNSISTSIKLPIAISLVLKMKTTKPAGRNNMLLASLKLESSEELINSYHFDSFEHQYRFKIIDLAVDFKFGQVSNISSDNYIFPLSFTSMDLINFAFKLVNNELMDPINKSEISKYLNIKLVLQVQKFDNPSKSFTNVSNIVTTTWAPYVDFSIIAPPINNALKTSMNYSHNQSQQVLPHQGKFIDRKPNLVNNFKMKSANSLLSPPSLSNVSTLASEQPSKRITSSSSTVTVNLATSNSSSLSGTRLTFKGKLSMKLGQVVVWKIQAINTSNNRTNLTILVQSNTPSGNPEVLNTITTKSRGSIIESPWQVYSTYTAQKLTTNGVLILDNDIRLGPLEPNGVFETDIKLLGISPGIFNLEGIKIFDITTGDGLDFGKLVEVFVT
jgi:hypothetical protein